MSIDTPACEGTAKYRQMFGRAGRFISENLCPVDTPVVYFDIDAGEYHRERLERVTLASNMPLKGYTESGGVFVKNMSPEEIAKFHNEIMRSLMPIGSYRAMGMDQETEPGMRYRLDGLWPSVEALRETLGLTGDDYALVRPALVRNDVAIKTQDVVSTTDDAVVVHELAHALNFRAGVWKDSLKDGHTPLEDAVLKVASLCLHDLPQFGGFRDAYATNKRYLDEGLAYAAEFAYLRKEHPREWGNASEVARKWFNADPHYFESELVLPYMAIAAGRETELFDAVKNLVPKN